MSKLFKKYLNLQLKSRNLFLNIENPGKLLLGLQILENISHMRN